MPQNMLKCIESQSHIHPPDKYSPAFLSSMWGLNNYALWHKGYLLFAVLAEASGSVISLSSGLLMEQISFDSGSKVPWSANSFPSSVLPRNGCCSGRHKEPLDASLLQFDYVITIMVKMEMPKGAEMSICGVQLQSDVSIFFSMWSILGTYYLRNEKNNVMFVCALMQYKSREAEDLYAWYC